MKSALRVQLLIIMAVLFSFTAYAQTDERTNDVYFITVKGAITGATHKFIDKSITHAEAENASAIVIKLDTPGGLLESTRDIVQSIMSAKIPVVVYVSPAGGRAGSAGAFITFAASYAYMAESTNIGAAHPVAATGGDIEGDMREKALNDTVSFMKSIAEKRELNAEAAIATVTESKSYTAKEALELGLITAIAVDEDELLDNLAEKIDKKSLNKIYLEPTLTEKLAFTLSSPNFLVLVLFIAVLMIFLEFKMPGTFVFAGVGIVAFIIFLIGINLIPINMVGLLLIALGIGLLVAEVFVSSYGLLAVAGIVALIGGMRLLFDTDKVQGLSVSLSLIIALAAILGGIVFFVGRLIFKDHKRKAVVGIEGIIGKSAKVIYWKDDKGQVDVRGEIWSATSKTPHHKGDTVTILSVEGLMLTVGDNEREK